MCEGSDPRLREMLTYRAVALLGSWELGWTFRAAVHGGHGFIQGSPGCRMPSEKAVAWMEQGGAPPTMQAAPRRLLL